MIQCKDIVFGKEAVIVGRSVVTLQVRLLQLKLSCMQFPDPHWKLRNRKKRIVQPQLVKAVANLLAPQGQVFLQSDVQEVRVSKHIWLYAHV